MSETVQLIPFVPSLATLVVQAPVPLDARLRLAAPSVQLGAPARPERAVGRPSTVDQVLVFGLYDSTAVVGVAREADVVPPMTKSRPLEPSTAAARERAVGIGATVVHLFEVGL